ncbi:hypothetical protein JF66_03200 [Cryobacterium sp. MLB-32]|nr:hypothetical protein JF66_03200 [Cryobacterium sp. MLB-32]
MADEPVTQIRAFLATERDSGDSLPDSAATDGLDMESSRLVGAVDGVEYFVAAYHTTGACIVMVTGSGMVGSSCGDNPNTLAGGTSLTGHAMVYQSTDEIPKGWEKVGDFLIVNPAAT